MDRRTTFANDRIAHVSLRGQVAAPRFSAGQDMRVITPVAPVFATPDSRALDRQLLMGAPVTVLETRGGIAFARDHAMGHVGHVPAACLGHAPAPTHRVSARATLAFAAPDFKSPDPVPLSLGTQVAVAAQRGRFAGLQDGTWVPARHLAPADQPAPDPVTIAETLLGTPYLWGGNSAFGIDCSGLVQIACHASGIACPGDSDLQEAHFPPAPTPDHQRGDLLFWKGHVAWIAGPDMLIHANAYHMAVAHEPTAQAIARIAAQGEGPVTGHARLLSSFQKYS